MSWPDDGQPRFVVDAQPTVRVLDRAYAFRVVTQVSSSHSRRTLLDHADVVAAGLNLWDAAEDAAA